MLEGIWHVAFHVADIDRSIAFYEALGMALVHRQEQSNAYTSSLVGYPDAAIRVAQFALPGADPGVSRHHLELVEYVTPAVQSIPLERRTAGTAHLAFRVADIAAEYGRLRDAGVVFVSQPNEITAGVNRGGFACYLLDPDGITLELVQPPVRREDAASA
jgi:catechol 2,3-dioxygenase-like lactoylglutathione lyase family enzyme